MSIPKVKFNVAPVNSTLPMIDFFLNPSPAGWDWSNSIYKHYPELKEKLEGIKDRKKRKAIESVFFHDIFQKERPKLEKRTKVFQEQWDKINDQVVKVLSEVVEQEWPREDKTVIARVSLNPICPRYIKERMFDVFYKQDPRYMQQVALHEILHFIYFEKWKQVFPRTKEKEFDAPYLVWQLSEMVPRVILGDKRVQRVLKGNFHSYKIYEDLKINGRPLLAYLQEFYDNRRDFSDFLRTSFEFVKRHQAKLSKP